MPGTVSIAITTNNISTTNKVRMAIYKDSAPSVMVQYIDEAAGAHLSRTWNFAGLDRVMHLYKLLELDVSNNTIATLIGPIYFLPSDETIEVKPAKLIQVGVTPIPGDVGNLWPVGINDVTVPDWIGWDIEMFERIGQGSLKYDETQPVDMSYNPATGYLHLNQPGDVWHAEDGEGEWFIARFKPRVTTSGSVITSSSNGFGDIMVITANTILTAGDVGKKILIDPAGNYLEVTLPSAIGVTALRLMYFEMVESSVIKCAKIVCPGTDKIQWLDGNLTGLWICPSETIEFYMRAVLSVAEWRVNNARGNFDCAGELIYDDIISTKVFNKTLLDGGNRDVFQFARLYNRYILRLTQNVLAYSAWTSINSNKYKHSLKDPVSNNFRVADSRYIYDRASNGLYVPGDFQDQMVLSHKHWSGWGESYGAPFGASFTGGKIGSNSTDMDNHMYQTDDGSNQIGDANPPNVAGRIGSENRPISRITYKYIRI